MKYYPGEQGFFDLIPFIKSNNSARPDSSEQITHLIIYEKIIRPTNTQDLIGV
jgi:hypothetical protein